MERIFVTALFIIGFSVSLKAEVITHQFSEDVSFQAVTWHSNFALATGTAGGIFLSDDDGAHWQQLNAPADSANLQFRDNQRLESGRLIVMSAGEGPASGLFISDDKGRHWQMVSQGREPTTFYDCFYMSDEGHGWLYGDSDEQGLFVLRSSEGGEHWQREKLPIDAQVSEGGFASSGTCVSDLNNKDIVIGTGNGHTPRLLLFIRGQWQSISSPIPGGEAGGIFSVHAVGDRVLAAGGSLSTPKKPALAWLWHLKNQQWQALPTLPFTGAVYGSSLLQSVNGTEYWISNPEGVAVLRPGAAEWTVVSTSNIWSLACQQSKGCMGVGKNGLIELYR